MMYCSGNYPFWAFSSKKETGYLIGREKTFKRLIFRCANRKKMCLVLAIDDRMLHFKKKKR